MDINFTRLNYTQVGPTLPRTTRLLPRSSVNDTQKVVVGNCDGVVQLFSLHKSNLQLVFKTLPSKPVSAVELGGALHSTKDKVFVASGNRVLGYTRRGKQFLNMETNLTDDIRSIHVSGSDLLVCADFVYNRYYECRESNYYLSSDNICDVISLSAEKTNALVPVLACADARLRVMKESGVRYSVETDGVPRCLHWAGGDGGPDGQWLLYGSSHGTVSCLHVDRDSWTPGWTLPAVAVAGAGVAGSAASITCLHHCDMTGDGLADLVVARDDGCILLYSYYQQQGGDEDAGKLDPFTIEPTLRAIYTASCAVSSVQAGYVSSAEHAEILVTTYSGWMFGLCPVQSQMLNTEDDVSQQHRDVCQATKERVLKLREELDALQVNVEKERAKQEQQNDTGRGAVVSTTGPLPNSTSTQFTVNDKMVLCSEDASYLLSLETRCALDTVLLQTDVPVDLTELEGNTAVKSVSYCEPASGNFLLATYRCQAGTCGMQVRLRTIEGQYGSVRVYILPRHAPKFCQMRQYRVAPLSLHTRVHHFDADRPYSSMVIAGRFSYSEAHGWVALCLPDVPSRCPLEATACLVFQSCFIGTLLQVNYTAGRMELKSDNISTMSIMKDVITKHATQRNILVSIDCDLNSNSVVHTLHIVRPRLEQLLSLAAQVAVLEPLQEVAEEQQDWQGLFLTPQHRHILLHATQLTQQAAQQSTSLQRLYGMITDLYIDHNKLAGVNVKARVPQLLEILDNFQFDRLVQFFMPTTSNNNDSPPDIPTNSQLPPT